MSSTEASWAVKEQDRERISEGENKAEELKENKRGKVCACVLFAHVPQWRIAHLCPFACAYIYMCVCACAECRDLKDSIAACV